MHPISLLFLGLCAFLCGVWLVRWREQRQLQRSGGNTPATSLITAPARPQPQAGRLTPPGGAIAPAIAHAVQQLIAQNQKIAAIKLIREHTGWSLAEAKKYVDQSVSSVAAQAQAAAPHALTPEVISAARQLMAEKQKIAAIKLIKRHTGWDLKQAKAYVETL